MSGYGPAVVVRNVYFSSLALSMVVYRLMLIVRVLLMESVCEARTLRRTLLSLFITQSDALFSHLQSASLGYTFYICG